MKTFWENDGQPNEQGKYVAVLQPEPEKNETGGEQRFEGEDHLEVANKLMVAQANATSKIATLTKKDPVMAPAADNKKPQPLTANDHFTLPSELNDAEKAADAVVKVVEARLGRPLERVGADLSAAEQNKLVADTRAAAYAFQQATPEYFVCQQNSQAMLGYMLKQGWDLTVEDNYKIAYERLVASNLLVVAPAGDSQPEGEQPLQPASLPAAGGLPASQSGEVTTRPRGVVHSSGLRAGDSSGGNGRGTTAPKYTREQIERMPADEYNNKMANEAGFAAFVDELYKAQPTR